MPLDEQIVTQNLLKNVYFFKIILFRFLLIFLNFNIKVQKMLNSSKKNKVVKSSKFYELKIEEMWGLRPHILSILNLQNFEFWNTLFFSWIQDFWDF